MDKVTYEEIPKATIKKLKRKLQGMIERCNSPQNKCYRLYGAKGIKVCEEWTKDRNAFVVWAVNHGYKDGLTIERIDSEKGYGPDNCTFIPNAQQPLNTSRNRFVLYRGEVLHLSEVARREGVSPEAIRKRIKFGWYMEVPNPNKGLS